MKKLTRMACAVFALAGFAAGCGEELGQLDDVEQSLESTDEGIAVDGTEARNTGPAGPALQGSRPERSARPEPVRVKYIVAPFASAHTVAPAGRQAASPGAASSRTPGAARRAAQ